MDLTTDYLGLTLANPIVASSSPLTGNIESLVELQEAGAAAVVLPSLFEEQVEHEAFATDYTIDLGFDTNVEAGSGYFPELDSYNTGTDWYLDSFVQANRELRIPVIASLNGASDGGWVSYADSLEDDGADATRAEHLLRRGRCRCHRRSRSKTAICVWSSMCGRRFRFRWR